MKGFKPMEKEKEEKKMKWTRKMVRDRTKRWMVRGRRSKEDCK